MPENSDADAHSALGDAILILRGLSAMNQSPRSLNASIIADAERVLIDAGLEDQVQLPKLRGFYRPARSFEKLDGGASIKAMHAMRREIEARDRTLHEPLPPPRAFDAEWLAQPTARVVFAVFALACIGSAISVLFRVFQ